MAPEILAFSDDADLLAQLTAKARRLGSSVGWSVSACRVDTGDPHQDAQACAGALAETAADADAHLVLIGATRLGMEVAPRLAERWDAGYAAWAQDVAVDPSTGVVTASCMLFAGTGVVEYQLSRDRAVLTVAGGVFDFDESSASDVAPLRLRLAATQSPITIVRSEAKPAPAEDLAHSKLVVDCGKGVASLEDLELARSLAALLGGHTACSRPLASERDWFSDWLGLSGMRIKPELCLTVGISGSVQHLIGIRDARVIAAVNHDEDAAIFTQADLGVVADIRDFLPALIERLEERAARPSWHDAGEGQPVLSNGPAVGHEE